MGRPKGSKNKGTEEEALETIESVEGQHEEERKETAKAVVLKPKLEPLGPGQKYFESPDGVILIGEEASPSLWYRAGNGGKGMWINPKR